MKTRGRPPKPEHIETPTKFKRTLIERNGITYVWKYNLEKFSNGPYEVEMVYPKGYLTTAEEEALQTKKIPKTKQRFINPKTGKEVSYQRAKELGIIK